MAAWLSARAPRVVRREAYGSQIHELGTPRLLLRRLGWLFGLAGGRLSLLGNPPLDVERASLLEPALKERWLDAPVGVFGLAQVEALEASGRLDLPTEASAAATFASSYRTGSRSGLLLRSLAALVQPSAWRASGA